MQPDVANQDVVQRFCDAFSRRDVDELVAFFADDAVYHNIPLAPVRGKAAIGEVLRSFVPGSPVIEFVMLNIASSGPVVFTERIDKLSMGGKQVELPVAGVFEIEDGKITAWRDYFDLQQLTSATGQ